MPSERRSLDESIEELRDIADGRNDILAEAAGITAGAWYAWPSTHGPPEPLRRAGRVDEVDALVLRARWHRSSQ